MVNNFTKYLRFYKVPILYQTILRVTLSISIIILTKIDSIRYITQSGKLRESNTIVQKLMSALKKLIESRQEARARAA